jgi:FKBP-type peptidyl-prolyl cis-trans isomerase
MKPGGTLQLVIPARRPYGTAGSVSVPTVANRVFEIEPTSFTTPTLG